MSVKITCDSTCDLTDEILKKYDISVIPLYVSLGSDVYKDCVDVFPEDLFSYVDRTKELPATTAINVADFTELFKRFSSDHEAIIHFDIGSEFSSCYQNACIAAAEFDNVYVIDTKSLCDGHGILVLEAAMAAERGECAEDIVKLVRSKIDLVDASFVLDKLDYLAKGGRCSSVTALGANLLKLKPCIELIDGKMEVGKKYRGSFDKAVLDYAKDRLADRDDLDLRHVFLAYTSRVPRKTIDSVHQAIEKYASFGEIIEVCVGSTISCHCGPVTLAIMFLTTK